MKILYLVNKNYHDSKMSRVRFHSMTAIGKVVVVEYFGLNWEDWDKQKTCQENIDLKFPNVIFDLVVGFKPLDMKGFKDIKFRKCIRYNEMYDKDWTITEIVQSGVDVVICHHYNDFKEYKELFGKVKGPKEIIFRYVPHSVERKIFKPIPEIKKVFDVIIVGATNVQTMLGEHYPLRKRMVRLLSESNKLTDNFKCKVIPHVGGSFPDAHTDRYAVDFAMKINTSKIVITDSGAPKSRFGKYIEVPSCGVALAGDVYNDHPNDVHELKKFLIEINMDMSDDEILSKIVYYLIHNKERKKLVEQGLEYVTNFTQEKYAERFLEAIK